MKQTDLMVFSKEGSYIVVNERLLTKQNAWHNLEKIKNVHKTKFNIFSAIRETTDPAHLRSYAQDLTLCEFELQRLWGFPEDANWHRFWETPKCMCPKMDNRMNYPEGPYIRNMGCPLHGSDT